MTPSLRARTTHRTLADRRLADLTAIAAVSGLAATIGFGWLAALTYAGVGSTSNTLNDSPGVVSAPRTVAGNNDPSTIGGGSTTTRPRSNTGTGSSSGGSSSGVSRGSGRAHISTGSS